MFQDPKEKKRQAKSRWKREYIEDPDSVPLADQRWPGGLVVGDLTDRWQISEEEAAAMLDEHAETIDEAMCQAGFPVLAEIMEAAGYKWIDDDGDDGDEDDDDDED